MPPDLHSDDAALMRAVQADDRRALRILVERWERPLVAFLYRYTQEYETARDLAQETFLRLYRSRERYDPQRRFSTWLFAIASNLCRTHTRWARRHPTTPLVATATDSDPANLLEDDSVLLPSAQVEEDESTAALRAAILRLPHPYRVAVLLHYYEALSYSEIAKVLGCTERGVETRLYRARKRLGETLARDDHPTSALPCAIG